MVCLVPGSAPAEPVADEPQAEERAEEAETEGLSEEELKEHFEDAPLNEEQEREQREQREAEEEWTETSGPTYEELHPAELNLFWRDGIRIERNDKRFRMKIGGRLQLDNAWIKGDRAIRPLFDTGTDHEVRRGWLDVTGVVRDRFLYKAQIDLSGESSGDDDRNRYIRELYVGWTMPGTLNGVRVGFSKEPFTMSDSTSAVALPFMERPLPIVFAPSYNLGVMLNGRHAESRISWWTGAFRYSGSGGGGKRLDLTGRVTALLWVDADDSRLLHLGASYSHQFRSDFELRYRRRPEAHLADRYVDTGDMIVDDVDLLGLELAAKWDAFTLQAEWVGSSNNRKDGSDVGFWGAYVGASWLVTGEQRPYLRRRGAFGRVAPNRPLSWKNGTWGALEAAARFSYLDLNNRDIRGGTINNVTFALSWLLDANYSITGNWVQSRLHGVGDTRIIQLRFQVVY